MKISQEQIQQSKHGPLAKPLPTKSYVTVTGGKLLKLTSKMPYKAGAIPQTRVLKRKDVSQG